MPRYFPGFLFGLLAGIPGICVAVWVSSPRVREKSLVEFAEMLGRATPLLFTFYAVPGLLYGSLAWFLLRALGVLNFGTIVLAGTLPVALWFGYQILVEGWWEPRAPWAILTMWLPALFISVGVWWFTLVWRSKA